MDEIEEEHDPVAFITEIGLFKAVLVANVLHLFCGVETTLNV